MAAEQITEGIAPFDIPSVDQPCVTYYKVFGDLRSGLPPVVVLHGGPGSGHNYLLAFRNLWNRRLPVILYDQIGTGKSTHLRHKKFDHTFWTVELMIRQLEGLIAHLHLEHGPGYHLLGHSVGFMISACFATRRPPGLQKLVLANAPGSVDLHFYGLELCWKELPVETQQAFEEAIWTRNWTAQSYFEAFALLNRNNWCRADPYPEELVQSRQVRLDDDTVLRSMWGQSACDISGSLKGWNCSSELHKNNVPTLLYRGQRDIEREEVVAP